MQHIPDKPAYLSSQEWQFVLNRDQRRCAFAGACARSGRVGPCDDHLDVDHAQPRELGGDDSIANVRLLCSSVNRGRKVEPAPNWALPNYWDESEVRVGKLRHIQQLAGWYALDPIASSYGERVRELRRVLLSSTTLLAGATGIGKTLLFQSVAFRINRLIGVGFPRIKHVLWLSTDNTLRDLAGRELEEEAYKLEITSRRPVVQVADSFDTLVKGPRGADIKVLTAHALWKVETDNGPRRSDDEIRAALAPFDTIVFDEGDWANEEVRHIAGLASHAWQFALTATPGVATLVGDGDAQKFLSRFVLIDPDAVADYARAVKLDGCLKLLTEPITGAGHDSFDAFEKGLRRTSPDKVREDLALSCSLILEAVVEADNLETRMSQQAPEDYYSPHIMARFDTIADIKLAAPLLQTRLEEFFANGILKNTGWNVAPLYQNMRGDFPAAMRDLSAKDKQGRWRHPFMIAKNTRGQAGPESFRVLLMCQIGVRGINNWPVQTIVDCTKRISLVDLAQFDLGRPIRWPNHLAEWVGIGHRMNEFASVKIMIPPTSFAAEKAQALSDAKTFVQQMREEIAQAGFLTWAHLLEGRNLTEASIAIGGGLRPVTQAEKFEVQALLADQLVEGRELADIRMDDLIDRAFPVTAPAVRSKLAAYGKHLLDPAFRRQELLAAATFADIERKPECVVDKLNPQERYEVETLLRWVHSDPLFVETLPECTERLKDGDRLTVDMVSERLRFIQRNNYRSPARIYNLNTKGSSGEEKGVFQDLADELTTALHQARQAPVDRSAIPRAIRAAAKQLFDIDTAKDGGPMDQPAYHIAMLGKYRRTLQAMARAMLIRNDTWPNLRRFAETSDNEPA